MRCGRTIIQWRSYASPGCHTYGSSSGSKRYAARGPHWDTCPPKTADGCDYGSLHCMDRKASAIKCCVKSVLQEDLILRLPFSKVSLHCHVDWVNPKLVTSLSLQSPAQYLSVMPPIYGIKVPLRLSTLPVHAHTAHYSRREGDAKKALLLRRVVVQCVQSC